MADAAVPTFDQSRFVDFLTLMRRASKGGLTKDHDPGTPIEDILPNINVLIVGAGGIGCELLHSLAVSPLVYCNYYVIDLDTIDLSNLNRQFLFREEHIGQPKATVAANEIKKRFPQMRIQPIHGRIEEQGANFYRAFHFILLGLDSVSARQWINSTVCTLYAEELAKVNGDTTQAFPVPMIDGGTEAYKGSVRRIEIGKSPCIECMMYQFPPARGVPMCTLENIPRSATHCVLYAVEKLFKDAKPFGEKFMKPDGDNEDHIKWIMEKAIDRQKQFKIEGNIDFQFTQGVTKNIVPAVGFSNALVAATIVNETVKMFTNVAGSAKPQVQYDGSCVMGVGSTTPFTFADPDCIECSPRAHVQVSASSPFSSVVQKAWEALCKFSGPQYVGQPLPARAKAVLSMNLMPNTIYPENNPACVHSAKAENNVTVGDAVLCNIAGQKMPIVAGETAFTVEFTIVQKSEAEKKAEAEAKKKQGEPSLSQEDAAQPSSNTNADEVTDVCGKKRGLVMVAVI